jgi:hypothetical protein
MKSLIEQEKKAIVFLEDALLSLDSELDAFTTQA